jgi:hypothetical protein
VEIETSIEIVPQGKSFNWSVKVQPGKGDQGGLTVSERAKSYVAARFQAGATCRKLAEAALNPTFEGRVLNYSLAGKTNSPLTGKAMRAAV